MLASKVLLGKGYQVDLYELTGRLGGKAGADSTEDGPDDHGYHIFPAWYLNIWKLVEDLGIEVF